MIFNPLIVDVINLTRSGINASGLGNRSNKVYDIFLRISKIFLNIICLYAKNIDLIKEPKLYLWDWSEIDRESARFENCVASHLIILVHFLQDWEGYNAQLYYLRSIEKKEVDFLVTLDKKPWFAVEAKINDVNASPHLYYYKDKLNIPFSYQVVKQNGVDSFKNGVRVISANRFLAALI